MKLVKSMAALFEEFLYDVGETRLEVIQLALGDVVLCAVR
jgi:hypothetical protein